MSRRLSFDFDVQKLVAATAYMAKRCPEATKMKLSKLLYFADKDHLLAYGRPITGDRYIKMEHGPVPSSGFALMKHDADRASREHQEIFDAFISVRGNDVSIIAMPEMDSLSESDIEILDETIARYGHLTAPQLRVLSHREQAWRLADSNSEMDFRFFFDRANLEQIRQLVEEDQELRDSLEDAECHPLTTAEV